MCVCVCVCVFENLTCENVACWSEEDAAALYTNIHYYICVLMLLDDTTSTTVDACCSQEGPPALYTNIHYTLPYMRPHTTIYVSS